MSEIGSMLFYFISFVISYLFYYLYNKNHKKIFVIISLCIPIFIGGFRFNVGTDYNSYIALYLNNIDVDIGFTFIRMITLNFGGYYLMFFVYNFLTLFIFFFGLEKCDVKYKSLAYLFYLFLFYTSSFNAMRQMLAVSIIFYSYHFIVEKKVIKFMITILLAFCFHTTSIIFLPIYFILNIRSKKLKYLFLILFALISFNFISIIEVLSRNALFVHYLSYMEYQNNITFNNYSFYVDLVILIYFMIFRKQLIKLNKKNESYFILFIISIILSFTGFINPFVKRISLYFKISEILLLAQLPFCSYESKNKLLHLVFICIYILFYFILTVFILKQADIIPYNTWL